MRFLLTASLLLLLHPLNAQVQFTSAAELLQYADQQNLSLKRHSLLYKAAQQQTAIVKSQRSPKLNGFANGDYYPIVPSQVVPASLLGGEPGKFSTVQFGMPVVLASGVELNIPLINFSLWEQQATARLQEKEVQLKAAADKEALHIQLLQLYYQHILLQQLLTLNHSNQLSLDTLASILDKRFDQGVLNPVDRNRMQQLVLDNRSMALYYQQLTAENKATLQALLQLPDSASLQITGSLQNATTSLGLPFVDIKDRPFYQQSLAQTAEAQQQLKEAKRANLPHLNFTLRYAYQWQANKHSTVHFDIATAGLKIEVPIFSGAYYKQKKRLAHTQVEAAELFEQEALSRLQEQQQQWQARLQQALHNQSLQEKKVKLAGDNLRIAQLSLREGIMEYDEFNNIYTTYNQTQMAYYQNLVDALLYHLLLTQKL